MRVTTGLRRRGHIVALAGLACATALLAPSAARADAVQTWNDTLLSVIRQTSGVKLDGPPEVAREMAIVGTAMSNAATVAAATQGANVDAAVNAAGYTAMLALFTKAGTPDNPNTGNTTTVGNLWQNFLTPAQNSNLLTEITNAYNAQAPSTSTTIGINAASDIIATRTGSLTNDTVTITSTTVNGVTTSKVTSDLKSDGSYASIVQSLNPNNYNPANGPLAPGANAATGVGVYVPLPSLATPGHIAIVPTWGGVSTMSTTGGAINTSFLGLSPPDVTGATYANALMQTYCTGGSSTAANFASVCAAAGVSTSTTGTIKGVTVSVPANSPLANVGNLSLNALYWNDPGTTFQPPGHWLAITDQVILNAASAGMALTEVQEAKLTALIGQAEHDAAIAGWGVKYNFNLWRPITAITGTNGGGTCQYGNWNATLNMSVGNGGYGFTCDSSWKSVIATPPHPDYVAGHPAFSGAAATVLTDFFGTATPGFEFSNTSDAYCNGSPAIQDLTTGLVTGCADPNAFVPGITETFDNFLDASDAATDSRVNGGIHTPFSVADALTIGNEIGQQVFQNSIPEPASFTLLGAGLLGLGSLRRRRT